MTQTRTELVQLADGRSLRLTFAVPDSSVRGGLVVLHEARGVTDNVRHLVQSLAAEGWLAVAPHHYHDDEGSGDIDAERAAEQVSALSGESVLADADIAFAWLAQHDVRLDLIGVVGFDLGGAVAMLVATSRDIGAAVSVSGGGILDPLSDGLPPLVDIAGDLRCPWLGLYGDHDPTIAGEAVEKLRDAAIGSGVATDVVRFEDNRFDDDQEGSAHEAWQRTLNWFDAHLR